MRYQYILALSMLMILSGCGGEAVAPPSDADVDATAAGVGKEAQVRYFIMEELNLATLELKPTTIGNYSAAGSDARGVTFDITIEQAPNSITYRWENSEGKKGNGSLAY